MQTNVTNSLPHRPGITTRNRRRSPRCVIDRRVLIRDQEGRIIQAFAHDLSGTGLQLRCDQATAYALRFYGEQFDESQARTYEIRLALPFAKELEELKAKCHLLYANPESPASPETIIVGLEFDTLSDEDAERLNTFLRHGATSIQS